MKSIFKYTVIGFVFGGFLTACSQNPISEEYLKETKLLAKLPPTYNSPASFALCDNNKVLFTSPNLHNDLFVEQGLLNEPANPVIGLISDNNNVSTWYEFKEGDMEPNSGTIVPMGIAQGPDGHMYVADMQLWAGGESRILRIKVKHGNVDRVEVVAKGLSFPNALVWKDDTLFISDTVLFAEKGHSTISGVYKINLNELDGKKPLQIDVYKDEKDHDAHLLITFQSSGWLGFGANGLAVDDNSNLYTGIMEDGTIFKTQLNQDDEAMSTVLFTKGLVAPDGIQWDARTESLYTTDLFTNSVYRINRDGKLDLLAQNGDTDGAHGELDAPGEAIVRGQDVIVNNFDAAFGVPAMVNSKPDAPATITIFQID